MMLKEYEQSIMLNAVSSQYLKSEFISKYRYSEVKFSGPQKFTFRYLGPFGQNEPVKKSTR